MNEHRTYKNPAGTKHHKHATVLDYDAIDQWRVRHELLRQALMKAERQLKRKNVAGALTTIGNALKDDKRIDG